MARCKPKSPKRKLRRLTNREYKSVLITIVLAESDSGELVCIPNAFADTRYATSAKVEINTLENVLASGPANDISFAIDDQALIFIEHQSTVCANMAYRILVYFAEWCKRYCAGKDQYGRIQLKLPHPKFIVLYNGKEDMPDEVTMRLSELFIDCGDNVPPLAEGDLPDIELTVKIYNINKGHNEEKIKACPALHQYCILIDKIREFEKTMDIDKAIIKAVEECIEQNILKDILLKRKGEVINMLTAEWNLETALRVEREEGEARGKAEERVKNARAMKADSVDVDTIARWTGMTVDDVLRL